MWLEAKVFDTEKYLTINKGNKYITVYKYLQRSNRKLRSILFNKNWRLGWNKSNSRRKKRINRDCNILRGIHVLITESETKMNWMMYINGAVLVKCKALKSDLLGCNLARGQASFKKIYLSKKEYEKHCQRGR